MGRVSNQINLKLLYIHVICLQSLTEMQSMFMGVLVTIWSRFFSFNNKKKQNEKKAVNKLQIIYFISVSELIDVIF